MTDEDEIHLLQSQEQIGSKRMSVAKCGEKVTHGKTERCSVIVAWWNDVTCPTCKAAGTDSVAHWRKTNPEPPAKPARKPKPKPKAQPDDAVAVDPAPETDSPALDQNPSEGPGDQAPTPGLESVVAGAERPFVQPGTSSRWPCPEPDDPDYLYVMARANEIAAEGSPAEAIEWAVNYAWGAAALNEVSAARRDPSSVDDKLVWSAGPQDAVEAM